MQTEFEQNIALCSSLYGYKSNLELHFQGGSTQEITRPITKKFPKDNLQVTLTKDQIIMVAKVYMKNRSLEYKFVFNEQEVLIHYLLEGWNRDIYDGYIYSHEYSMTIANNQMVSAKAQRKWTKIDHHFEKDEDANETMQAMILEYVVNLIELLAPRKAIQEESNDSSPNIPKTSLFFPSPKTKEESVPKDYLDSLQV